MQISLLVLASLLAFAACQVNFVGNVTVQNTGQFVYRDINTLILNVPNFVEGVFFSTFSVPNGTNQKDVVSGAFYVETSQVQKTPPTAAVSFFTAYSTWQQAAGAAGQEFNFNAQLSDAFVAKAFLSLEEVNSTNNVTVRTVSLANDLTWALTTPQTLVNGFLQTATLTGTNPQLLGAGFSVTITVVFSQILGLLNVAGTPVITPKSLVTVVNITNYPYKAPTNALRLNLVVATQTVTLTVTDTVTVITSGNGTTGTYVQINKQVQADGNTQTATVTVTSQTAAGTSGNTYVDAQMQAKYQRQFTVTQVAVQFPAGAKAISFSPSAGTGPAPQVTAVNFGSTTTPGHNSQGRLTPILALLFLLVVILF